MSDSAFDAIRFQPASDQSLLLYFGEQISLETHHRIVQFLSLLEAKPVTGIRNLHPAYCSVLVQFDATKLTHAEVESLLLPYFGPNDAMTIPAPRLREIPVCYGGDFGPDLVELAALHDLSAQSVVKLHCSPIYTVYFLGFVPGFAYLGGLPDELTTARLNVPRKQVPAGSVAIGGNQTGVYPTATPGGWRLIGRTPLKLFEPDRAEMSLLSIGDQVRFVPVSRQQFDAMVNE
jgi:inhibitor of KinA